MPQHVVGFSFCESDEDKKVAKLVTLCECPTGSVLDDLRSSVLELIRNDEFDNATLDIIIGLFERDVARAKQHDMGCIAQLEQSDTDNEEDEESSDISSVCAFVARKYCWKGARRLPPP